MLNEAKSKKNISFKTLIQLEKDGVIEEYDLFNVSSDCFDNMVMTYMDNEFYLVTASKKLKQIDRSLLDGRHFIYTNNYVKRFIADYGQEVFNLLTLPELISVITGEPVTEKNLGEER